MSGFAVGDEVRFTKAGGDGYFYMGGGSSRGVHVTFPFGGFVDLSDSKFTGKLLREDANRDHTIAEPNWEVAIYDGGLQIGSTWMWDGFLIPLPGEPTEAEMAEIIASITSTVIGKEV